MSRSHKKLAIVKDSGKRIRYWRSVRIRIKNVLNSFKEDYEELELPNPKTIVNDYNYCDSLYYAEYATPTTYSTEEDIKEDRIKIKRK